MKLTKEQLNNLLVFLNRVSLQGNEAELLVEIKIELTKELQKLKEVQKKEEKN